MEKSFSNQKELFMKLRPALRTKRHELIVNGIKFVKLEDIWTYNIENNWRGAKGLTIASMVNDILNTNDQLYADYAYKKNK